MRVKRFIPFYRPDLGKEELEEIRKVLDSGWITTGPVTGELEKEIKRISGSKYALALNSCTAALHLALTAMGIGPEDEVIVPSFTFAATANVVIHVGAKPVFADIKEDDLTLDPRDVERRLTTKTKAIIPVHFAGYPADMDRFCALRERYGVKILEDAAHALGSQYRGKPIGSIGDVTAFSFHAVKNLTTAEGGMATTDNREIYERMKLLSLHGLSKDAWTRYRQNGSSLYSVVDAGYKYNLPDVLAAIGVAQLKKFQRNQQRREKLFKRYLHKLRDIPGLILPKLPREDGTIHGYHLFVIRIQKDLGIGRDQFILRLKERGVGTSVHFQPLHLQPFYRKHFGCGEGMLEVTERIGNEVVSLPLFPQMSEEEQDYIVEVIKEVVSEVIRV